jgi:hypothetical protein
MHSGTSKSAARKSVRVATTVTGITACAAAFAAMPSPQAEAKPIAQSTGRAATYKIVNYKIGANPDATSHKTCSRSPEEHWFHAYNSKFSVCVAGPDGTSIPVHAYQGFCGGNNKGYFSGYNYNHVHQKHTFGRGTSIYWFGSPTFPDNEFFISKVYVSNWSGQDECGTIG